MTGLWRSEGENFNYDIYGARMTMLHLLVGMYIMHRTTGTLPIQLIMSSDENHTSPSNTSRKRGGSALRMGPRKKA